MLTCSNCGAVVREGAKFCTTCGTRLNDVAATAPSAWSAPETPAAPDTSPSPDVDATIAAPAWAAPAEPASDAAAGEPATPQSDQFTWSWGSPATASSPESTGSEGTVADAEADSSDEPAADTPDLVAEVAGDDTGVVPGVDGADADGPDLSESLGAYAVATDDRSAFGNGSAEDETGQDTLADWAGNWDSNGDDEAEVVVSQPDAVEETAAVAESVAVEETAAVAEEVPVEETAAVAVDDAGEETPEPPQEEQGSAEVPDIAPPAAEVTVSLTRAEELLDELKTLLPALAGAGATAASPQQASEALAIAGDLEGAARVGEFDDVSVILLAARDNPRDVDNMLKLSATVDRLLELLDDRNNLAKTAENAATRLREAGELAE